MTIVKNIILGLIGAYATFQLINVGQSAVHQIYGAVLLVVATMCVGFFGGGK